MDFSVVRLDGKYCGEHVVGGVSLDHELPVGHPMRKDQSGGESFLKVGESRAAFVGQVPGNGFACESGERNGDSGVIVNEASIEIGEA